MNELVSKYMCEWINKWISLPLNCITNFSFHILCDVCVMWFVPYFDIVMCAMLEGHTISDLDADYCDGDNDNNNNNNNNDSNNNSDDTNNSESEAHWEPSPSEPADSSVCQQLHSVKHFQCKPPYEWIEGPLLVCLHADYAM